MAARTTVGRWARRVLPARARTRLRRRYERVRAWPPPGRVEFGDLRRVTPFSRRWGQERGTPVDRHYIDAFLRRRSVGFDDRSLVRGRVLEVGAPRYAPDLAEPGGIERLDILDVSADNPEATVIADLSAAEHVPTDAFDCIICTQTLLLIYDVGAAVRTLHRILKPGGALLATVPGISQICRPEMEVFGDYWRFTTKSIATIFERSFDGSLIEIESHGNVLSATAFLFGLAAEDLDAAELRAHDPDYQLVIAIRAIK